MPNANVAVGVDVLGAPVANTGRHEAGGYNLEAGTRTVADAEPAHITLVAMLLGLYIVYPLGADCPAVKAYMSILLTVAVVLPGAAAEPGETLVARGQLGAEAQAGKLDALLRGVDAG